MAARGHTRITIGASDVEVASLSSAAGGRVGCSDGPRPAAEPRMAEAGDEAAGIVRLGGAIRQSYEQAFQQKYGATVEQVLQQKR